MKSFISKIESSKLGEQIFRFVRIGIVGAVSTILSGNPVTGAAIVAAFEAAFRQVFPSVPL